MGNRLATYQEWRDYQHSRLLAGYHDGRGLHDLYMLYAQEWRRVHR